MAGKKDQQSAEDILADLDKKKGSNASDSKTAYYRKKKAQEFVQGYILVKQLRENLEEGEKFTEAKAVEMLIEHWEDKAEAKEEVEI